MPVYHLEIRKFPKALTRFNQSGPQLGAVVLQWVQEKIIDLDDQKWNPLEATITILQGPPIPVENLSMGRGWRTALRDGEDVTERVLAEARQALADGSVGQSLSAAPAQPGSATAGAQPLDPLTLGVELAGLLGPDASELLAAWRAVARRSNGLSPSESLALAERELRSSEPPPG